MACAGHRDLGLTVTAGQLGHAGHYRTCRWGRTGPQGGAPGRGCGGTEHKCRLHREADNFREEITASGKSPREEHLGAHLYSDTELRRVRGEESGESGEWAGAGGCSCSAPRGTLKFPVSKPLSSLILTGDTTVLFSFWGVCITIHLTGH